MADTCVILTALVGQLWLDSFWFGGVVLSHILFLCNNTDLPGIVELYLSDLYLFQGWTSFCVLLFFDTIMLCQRWFISSVFLRRNKQVFQSVRKSGFLCTCRFSLLPDVFLHPHQLPIFASTIRLARKLVQSKRPSVFLNVPECLSVSACFTLESTFFSFFGLPSFTMAEGHKNVLCRDKPKLACGKRAQLRWSFCGDKLATFILLAFHQAGLSATDGPIGVGTFCVFQHSVTTVPHKQISRQIQCVQGARILRSLVDTFPHNKMSITDWRLILFTSTKLFPRRKEGLMLSTPKPCAAYS